MALTVLGQPTTALSPSSSSTPSNISVLQGGTKAPLENVSNDAHIAIPSSTAMSPTAYSTGGSGSTSGTYSAPTTTVAPATPTLDQATINTILDSIANQVQSYVNQYNKAATENATADKQEQLDYNNQVQQNTANHSAAIQDAEQAAASGGKGLDAVLASLGALDGTGAELAGRAVADSANNDIGTADKTFQTNATAIKGADTKYRQDAANRDSALQAALAADKQNARSTGYQQILNDAHNIGDTATYNKYLPDLVKSTAPVQQLAPSSITYNPASVNSYAPPSNLTVASAPSTNSAAAKAVTTPVNSALYVKKTN